MSVAEIKRPRALSTYESCHARSVEYFDGDELAASVFLDKYALRDQDNNILEPTPYETHKRLAREFARIEAKKFAEPLTYDEILESLDFFRRIVCQGGPTYGIGNPYRLVSLSNCYVIEPPLDSYGGIFLTDEQLVQISKRRGGVGTDLSHLRPIGAATRNSSRTSTGIPSFMQRYSNSIREVGQDGRRGALMLTLSVHHPDVLEFAKIKNDGQKVTGANISVRLSDEFLKAVKDGTDYEQRWPVEGTEPRFSRWVDARQVWMEIIHNAWLRAEPGLLFWDHLIRESPADCYHKYGFRTVSTNPCRRSSDPVLTPNGIRQIADIEPGDAIWSSEGWTIVTDKFSTGVNRVYEYETTAGTFYGTEQHRVVSRGMKTPVCEAQSIDIITGPYNSDVEIEPQDIVDGIVMGDGTCTKECSSGVGLIIGDDDQDYFQSEVSCLIGRLRHRGSRCYDVHTTIKPSEVPHTYQRRVPSRFLRGDRNKVCGFLRGLYTANGSNCGRRITLKAASKGLIQDVQMMLSSIGIRSYYTTNRPSRIKFKNGTYTCRESYDLNITRDRDKFAAMIGFVQQYKSDKMWEDIQHSPPRPQRPKVSYDIIAGAFVSEEETFDITVDNASRTYWSGGCDVSNCGELPLSVLDSCRLMFLNLTAYIRDPFTTQANFDFDAMRKDAVLLQRLMDDLIDLELESIDKIIAKVQDDPEPERVKAREVEMWQKIRDACFNGRRTGSGITGLGDCLAMLGLKYGSDEAIEMTEQIYRTLKLGCYRSSVEMAKELGPFPIFDASLEAENPFLLRIRSEDPELYADMQKYGRRNIALLTTAPVGSLSIQTQTTSGIEPMFSDEPFTRRKKINHGDTEARVDFVDQSGDRWTEFRVYPRQITRWMEITGETDPSQSPYRGSCAHDLDWKQRVRLQASAQRHVDHAISNTINLPHDVSVEQVARVYETAWEAGCKGVTVYRDGCRSGVLIKDVPSPEPDKIRKTQAPKRPETLVAEVHQTTIKGKRYAVVVGLMGGDPYEVFAVDTAIRIKDGVVKKTRRGSYQLMDAEGEVVYEKLVGERPEEEDTITRLTSTSLRHGVDTNFIVHQLEKVGGSMHSFAAGLARVLKKYIANGSVVHGEVCVQCGNAAIVREEGCQKCKNCGWSRC